MKTGAPWTARMIERLQELLEDPRQLSYKGIAAAMTKEFGTELTKNACIGKARRLGVAMRDKTPREAIGPRPKLKKIKVDAPIPPAMDRLPDLRLRTGITIYQLREGDCRWPLGPATARPPFQYCGAEAVFGEPYCDTHHDLGHTEPFRRNRKATT